MPEVTDAQLTEYHQYKAIAPTPTDVTRKIDDLVKDSGKQRDEIRDLKEKLKGLPAEGAEVLTGDDATEWKAFKALDVKSSDVKTALTERDTLKTEKAQRDRRDKLAKAVTTEGWSEKSTGILARLIGDKPLELEDEDVEVQESGKSVKKKMPVGYVTVDGKPVRLSEWAKTEDGLVELLAGGTNSNGGTGGGTGRPAPEQFGGGGKTPGRPTEEDVKKSTARTADYIL